MASGRVMTRYQNGALIHSIYPSRGRIIAAIGGNVTKQIPNWADYPVASGTLTSGFPFISTQTGTNTAMPQTDGTLLVTTGATEYHGDNMQHGSPSFALKAAAPIYCSVRAKMDSATLCDFLFGLCSLKLDLMATSSAHATSVTDGAYFSKIGGAGLTPTLFTTEHSTTETNTTAVAVADVSWHWYEIYCPDATTVYAYYDGTLVATHTTNLPTLALTLSFNIRAGSAAARTCQFDSMSAVQIGAR